MPDRRRMPAAILGASNRTLVALDAVCVERERQEQLVAERRAAGNVRFASAADPDLDPDAKLAILVEEVGEVARCLNDDDSSSLETELVQVAAVAVAWVEAITARRLVVT